MSLSLGAFAATAVLAIILGEEQYLQEQEHRWTEVYLKCQADINQGPSLGFSQVIIAVLQDTATTALQYLSAIQERRYRAYYHLCSASIIYSERLQFELPYSLEMEQIVDEDMVQASEQGEGEREQASEASGGNGNYDGQDEG